MKSRKYSNLKLSPIDDERGLLRDRMLVLLHAKLTDILMEVSPGLTLNEMLVREAVFVARFRGIVCDVEYISKEVGISVSSANRKLSKLLAMRLIEQSKVGKKYVYETPEGYMKGRYQFEDGRPVLDEAVDEIISIVDKMIR